MTTSDAKEPTWSAAIFAFFSDPYWIPAKDRHSVGDGWAGCMEGYQVHLHDYRSVQQYSVQIYQFLHSREMPLSPDPKQQWPDEALEIFRIWVNQGWRQTASDPFDLKERIPPPRARIGCAVPHWNWYASGRIGRRVAVSRSAAGLQRRDLRPSEDRQSPAESVAHRRGQGRRQQGLCWQVGRRGGRSASVDCRWVQRDPLLYTSGAEREAERKKKIAMVLVFQRQVHRALAFKDFSHPQGAGFPWANIQTFDPPPPDSKYRFPRDDKAGSSSQASCCH